ncbi:MAG: Flp family type IVb pilin [Deltaproteobacteria bacterium]|nr:Flp family type IVb pilin [Deltaproteobacteria bacterium]
MTPAKHLMKRLWTEDEAANAVEYGLITAVVAIALIGALFTFRQRIVGMFSDAADSIANRPR